MKIALNIALGILLAFKVNASEYWYAVLIFSLILFVNFIIFVYETTGIEFEIKRKIIESDLRRKNKKLAKKIKHGKI